MLYQLAVSFLCLVVVPGIAFFLGKSFETAIYVFSIIMAVYLFFLCFVEANRIGEKEWRNSNLYKPFALKGLVYGLIGELPVWVITLVLILSEDYALGIFEESFRVYVTNIFTIEFLWLFIPMKFSVVSYVIAFSIVPFVCGFGYLMGYRGFSFEDRFGAVNKGR
jgi:hypothetical protein